MRSGTTSYSGSVISSSVFLCSKSERERKNACKESSESILHSLISNRSKRVRPGMPDACGKVTC